MHSTVCMLKLPLVNRAAINNTTDLLSVVNFQMRLDKQHTLKNTDTQSNYYGIARLTQTAYSQNSSTGTVTSLRDNNLDYSQSSAYIHKDTFTQIHIGQQQRGYSLRSQCLGFLPRISAIPAWPGHCLSRTADHAVWPLMTPRCEIEAEDRRTCLVDCLFGLGL